jgi:Flp pilus assembly protein TadG
MFESPRRQRDRGANLVEFALIMPLLFLLLFGVIEFARLIYGYSTVWNGAREGARYATTVGDTDSDGVPNYLDCDAIEAAAISKVAGVDLTTGDITVKYFDADGTEIANCDADAASLASGSTIVDSGFTIEVEASGTFDAVVPLLSSLLNDVDVSSTQSRSIFKGVVGG